jgi:hypothetical protein
MEQAQVFQEGVGRGHDGYFLHNQTKIRRVTGDIFVSGGMQNDQIDWPTE